MEKRTYDHWDCIAEFRLVETTGPLLGPPLSSPGLQKCGGAGIALAGKKCPGHATHFTIVFSFVFFVFFF